MNIIGVEIATIGSIGSDGKDEMLVDGTRQYKATVVINMLADKVDPAWCHNEQRLARESGIELRMNLWNQISHSQV